MPDHITKPIMVIIVWSALYSIPLLGIRSNNLTLGLVWLRFRKFLPVCVFVAFVATISGGLMSGTVGAVGSMVGSLLSTTWLFLTYVIYKVND